MSTGRKRPASGRRVCGVPVAVVLPLAAGAALAAGPSFAGSGLAEARAASARSAYESAWFREEERSGGRLEASWLLGGRETSEHARQSPRATPKHSRAAAAAPIAPPLLGPSAATGLIVSEIERCPLDPAHSDISVRGPPPCPPV